MLKSKLVLTIASLAFVVSCTNSGDKSAENAPSSPDEVLMNVSRLEMDGSQALASLDFGSVAQNKSATKRLTLKNDTAQPLALSFALSNNADPGATFSISSNSCPASLGVLKSCQISIVGKGAVNGTPAGSSFPGLLSINSGSHEISLDIKVTGTAQVAPATDADLIFSTVAMADEVFLSGVKQSKEISVKNNSVLGTHPGGITTSADGWALVSSTCAAPLKPKATCKMTLSFTSWKTQSASSLSYQGSVGGQAISSAVNPTASVTTCKAASTRILKAWKSGDTKNQIVTTTDVGNASALTRETVQPYQVGVSNVLEICNPAGTAVSKQLDQCPANHHKVEPKSLLNATVDDFYCEPDTVTCT